VIAEGIILGLVAAVFQSFCYVYTRIFVSRPGYKSGALFALSHAWMGLFALALLPFAYNGAQVARVSLYIWPLLGSVGFYMAGQVCLIHAVKATDASRVSPLLGLKILILSLITVTLFHNVLTPLQWLSVLMSLGAALALNYSGGGAMPVRSVVMVLGACVGYSFSDLCIVALVQALSPENGLRGILLASSLTYILASVVGLILVGIGHAEDRTPEKWRAALPMAITWFAAMVFLFISLRQVGAVFGNIVQSMRGPFSILIGMAIAARGHVALERRVGSWVLVRRLAAALLMCAAIGLFAHERARVEEKAKQINRQLTMGNLQMDAEDEKPGSRLTPGLAVQVDGAFSR